MASMKNMEKKMAEISYIKTIYGLTPATKEDQEKHDRYKLGGLISGKFSEKRNGGFHRKFFAMLDVGFEAWSPVSIGSKWGDPEKNRGQFREDVTIKAGYYEVNIRLDLSVRIKAKSIKFGKMKQDEFERLYSNVANVLLKDVLHNYTRDDLDRVVDTVLGFV